MERKNYFYQRGEVLKYNLNRFLFRQLFGEIAVYSCELFWADKNGKRDALVRAAGNLRVVELDLVKLFLALKRSGDREEEEAQDNARFFTREIVKLEGEEEEEYGNVNQGVQYILSLLEKKKTSSYIGREIEVEMRSFVRQLYSVKKARGEGDGENFYRLASGCILTGILLGTFLDDTIE